MRDTFLKSFLNPLCNTKSTTFKVDVISVIESVTSRYNSPSMYRNYKIVIDCTIY